MKLGLDFRDDNNEAGQVEVKWTSTDEVKSTTTKPFIRP